MKGRVLKSAQKHNQNVTLLGVLGPPSLKKLFFFDAPSILFYRTSRNGRRGNMRTRKTLIWEFRHFCSTRSVNLHYSGDSQISYCRIAGTPKISFFFEFSCLRGVSRTSAKYVLRIIEKDSISKKKFKQNGFWKMDLGHFENRSIKNTTKSSKSIKIRIIFYWKSYSKLFVFP